MKWRQTLLLLLVFLIAGGYYYTVEVKMKETKETAEKEAKKIFNVSPYKVTEVELDSAGAPPLKLRSEGGWHITEPFPARGDKGAVENLVRTLADMESEKVVLETVDDLKPYGLENPAFRARFLADGKWYELQVGEKSPTESGYFAKTGDGKKLLLIALGNFGAVNRKPDELRRRDLADFQPDQVTRLLVAWKSGERVALDRSAPGAEWKAEGGGETRIKTGKVDTLLSRIQWLKARRFLENGSENAAAYGLDPAFVTVEVGLKSGEPITIRLAEEDPREKTVDAVSSQLPGVTVVEGSILGDLPKNVGALEDRALLGVNQDAVDAILWKLGDETGKVVRMDAMKWGAQEGSGVPKQLKESWRIKSLFWDLVDGEYLARVEPAPAAPGTPSASLVFEEKGKEVASLLWERLPEGGAADPVTVRLRKDGKDLAVTVDPKAVSRIELDMSHLKDTPAP